MSAYHLASLGAAIVAGACFLLDAFGTDHLGPLAILPLGLLFFVISVALCHHHHPAGVA